MRTITKYMAGIILATTSIIFLPATSIADIDWPAVDPDINAAYENLSGTHPSTAPKTAEGVRGREGMKGEAGMASAKRSLPAIDQAFEDFSGTHPTAAAVKAGMKGSSGMEGVSGSAGKAGSNWSQFNLPGDMADGCSKYLRCSNE
ncbi:MAG: hypothetical protein WCD07_07095 [Burkholderiales bacterium]